jgi:hypothetical protein
MLTSCIAVLLLQALSVLASDEVNDVPPFALRCSPDTLSEPRIGRGVTILSVEAKPQYNFTSIEGGSWLPALSDLSFCQVQIYLTHQTKSEIQLGHEDSKDKVLVEVWLPLDSEDWNGRFQATGGAGFSTGMFGAHLGVAVKNGWAAVSTDGGHDPDLAKLRDGSWILSKDEKHDNDHWQYGRRRVNWTLLHNFASRSLVDQILIGKSITEQYYGKKPHHSYWNGCSTGGRQGYAIAQKYPELLDGILATAPALSFVNLVMGELWPHVMMREFDVYLSNCELEYFRYQAITACEESLDVKTGILENPELCERWDPHVLEGEKFECDGQEVTVSSGMASVVQAIHTGPGINTLEKKFPGLAWGVPMTTLANITIAEDGTRSPNPFRIALGWYRDVVWQGNLANDLVPGSEGYMNSLWVSALSEYGGILNTDDPDLSKLRDSGSKLLTWHGIDDALIPYQNTVNYRRKVEALMGSANNVDEYYRLFLAPGVDHCGGGVGPIPRDPLDALVKWVEEDEAPEILHADIIGDDGDLITRDLCVWPSTAQYMGIGDIKRASTWTCVGGTERPRVAEQVIETEFEYGSMQQPPKVAGKKTTKLRGKAGRGSDRAEQILGGLKDRIEGLGMGLRVA